MLFPPGGKVAHWSPAGGRARREAGRRGQPPRGSRTPPRPHEHDREAGQLAAAQPARSMIDLRPAGPPESAQNAALHRMPEARRDHGDAVTDTALDLGPRTT